MQLLLLLITLTIYPVWAGRFGGKGSHATLGGAAARSWCLRRTMKHHMAMTMMESLVSQRRGTAAIVHDAIADRKKQSTFNSNSTCSKDVHSGSGGVGEQVLISSDLMHSLPQEFTTAKSGSSCEERNRMESRVCCSDASQAKSAQVVPPWLTIAVQTKLMFGHPGT